MGFSCWVLWVFRVFHRIWCWAAGSPAEERENRGRERGRGGGATMPFAGARPHRSSPHTAHHRLLLLVSFPLLLFSPPQTNPLYKAKNTRETERDKIIRLTASSMGSSGSWFPVPYRRISIFNRRRSLRSKSAMEGAPEVDPGRTG
jgi:hypothetical protein